MDATARHSRTPVTHTVDKLRISLIAEAIFEVPPNVSAQKQLGAYSPLHAPAVSRRKTEGSVCLPGFERLSVGKEAVNPKLACLVQLHFAQRLAPPWRFR
jgi:hypothetical protein